MFRVEQLGQRYNLCMEWYILPKFSSDNHVLPLCVGVSYKTWPNCVVGSCFEFILKTLFLWSGTKS